MTTHPVQGAIHLHRPAAFGDKFRRYRVVVDGAPAGELAERERLVIPVTPGPHVVQLRIDWCASPELRVDVPAGGTRTLECGPAANPLLVLLYVSLFRHRYLWLRPAPHDVAPVPAPAQAA